MGADLKKKLPLPAATESDSTAGVSEIATDLSRATEKSSYSLPEDGSPITISTRRKQEKERDIKITKGSHLSQTSLLIEYFEGGKEGKSDTRRPSVRVRVTPSSHRKSKSTNDHIQITESKGNRKPSYTKRISLNNFTDDQEAYEKSLSEATSSNVTSNGGGPIEIEVAPPRRHGSPLIPSEAKQSTYLQELNPSDISSMPANSFLDGSRSTQSPRRKRSKSFSSGDALIAGVAAGAATAAVADHLKAPKRSRSISKERITKKAIEKIKYDHQSERRRRHSSKSRPGSASGEKDADRARTPRLRSGRNHNVDESLVSGTDSSLLSSQPAPSQQSFQSGSSSLNNPKLLATVEDAIRRLILPELTELKRQQSKQGERRDRHRERRGSTTSGSVMSREPREESSGKPRSNYSGKDVSESNLKGRKEAVGDVDSVKSSERSFERGASEETVTPGRDRKKRTASERHRGIEALAAGGAIGALTAAALHKHDSKENLDDTRERRRRRNKGHDHDPGENQGNKAASAMPLMSEVNSSEMTRTSIRSAESDRPLPGSEEQLGTPIREVPRGNTANLYGSPSTQSSRTPTRTPLNFQQGLGTQHNNYSRGDLNLGSQNSKQQLHSDGYEVNENGGKILIRRTDEESDEADHPQNAFCKLSAAASTGLAPWHHSDEEQSPIFSKYGQYTQHVPPPLKYVPYAQDNNRRGLSPIQSVSSWQEKSEQDPNHRDSGLARSVRSYSSFDKQSQQQRESVASYNSLVSVRNVRQPNQHDFAEVREGGLAESELTQESQDPQYWEEQQQTEEQSKELDERSSRTSNPYSDHGGTSGQHVQEGAATNVHVYTPFGVESAVASLVDGSVLTGESNHSGQSNQQRQTGRQTSYASFDEGSERHFTSRGNSPAKQDEYNSPSYEESQHSTPNKPVAEHEVDENGRKVSTPNYRRSNLVGAGVVGAAAGLAVALASRNDHSASQERKKHSHDSYGALGNKTFKERAMEALAQAGSSQRSEKSFEEGDDHIPIKMSAGGFPDVNDPMPDIGYGDEESEVTTNPSVIRGYSGGIQSGSRDHSAALATPPLTDHDGPRSANSRNEILKAAEESLTGAVATKAGDIGGDQDEDLRRTSAERKRNTLLTNPYEDMEVTLGSYERADHFQTHEFGNKNLSSPLGGTRDEGYISSAPNGRSPDDVRSPGPRLAKQGLAGEPSGGDDPFYTSSHSRHLSGMSEGLDSPVYDGATGNIMERIRNKDIIALMEHLTVRDAQRSARDTEILVTLVRAAAENRNHASSNQNQFEDLKRLLADTEDVIITEVQRNTDKSVQKVMSGPRLQSSSAPRSLRSQDLNEDSPQKRRNVFKRALKSLGLKSTNDLGRIEDLMMQILGEVEDLKRSHGISQQRPQAGSRADSYNDMQEDVEYEHDRGYEPEGHAGTSTASYASQSGHFSNPHSRGTSAVRGFDSRRDFSDHRISTVPEADEEEVGAHEQKFQDSQLENNEALLTPTREIPRGSSAPLNSPPQVYVAEAPNSSENTPKAEKNKKHKSSSSSGWLPKISRWSETTASTVAKGFRSNRSSKQKEDLRPASKSGSDHGSFEEGQKNGNNWSYVESDKLAFSQDGIPQYDENEPLGSPLLPPEDPKYKAHRNSLNLQHPQPRPGPTHRHQTALEFQAQDFGQAQSPKSVDWGSNLSLNRLPQINPHRYSDGSNLSPISDGTYPPNSSQQQNENQSTAAGPPRPPKEPLDATPEHPSKVRNKLSKPSPLNNELSTEQLTKEGVGQYRTATGHLSPVYDASLSSPRSIAERRPSALGVPGRKPVGPRSMSTASKSGGELDRDNGTVIRRSVNRDTFGSVASHHSGESEIF